MKQFRRTLAVIACSLMLLPTTTAYAATYTVLKNDSLYKISQLFKTPVSTIKQDNKLTSDTIYPGQRLEVTASSYTVKSGDTLYLIATRHGISLSNLRTANNKWDDMLIPGQKLILPAKATAATTGTVIPYTQSEFDLLARLIEAEASGEIYKAKVAVGAVVVNRVQSSDWPNSISAVINQTIDGYTQFTPVKNGMINKKASDDSIRAAWDALYGSDPSNGAIFYFDDSSTNQWLWSKTQTAYIDNMVFVK